MPARKWEKKENEIEFEKKEKTNQQHRTGSTRCDATEKLLDLQKGVNIIYTLTVWRRQRCAQCNTLSSGNDVEINLQIYQKLLPAFLVFFLSIPSKLESQLCVAITTGMQKIKRANDSQMFGHILYDLPETKRKRKVRNLLYVIFDFYWKKKLERFFHEIFSFYSESSARCNFLPFSPSSIACKLSSTH